LGRSTRRPCGRGWAWPTCCRSACPLGERERQGEIARASDKERECHAAAVPPPADSFGPQARAEECLASADAATWEAGQQASAAAEALCREVLAVQCAQIGYAHPDTLRCRMNLASMVCNLSTFCWRIY
jgi:hypothetical protein